MLPLASIDLPVFFQSDSPTTPPINHSVATYRSLQSRKKNCHTFLRGWGGRDYHAFYIMILEWPN